MSVAQLVETEMRDESGTVFVSSYSTENVTIGPVDTENIPIWRSYTTV